MRSPLRRTGSALAATDVPRGLLMVDDAHRIGDPAVFELRDALLEHLPPQWGLLIASRVDPPLALARMRVRGGLAEFRQQDLAFSGDELKALHIRAPRWPSLGWTRSPSRCRG